MADALKRFRFSIATAKEDDTALPVHDCLDRMNTVGRYDVSTEIRYGNREGLSAVYNSSIGKALEDGIDYLVCVHDDIWLNDVLLFDKIESASKDYGLIGVCGGKAWEAYGDGRTPIIWTHATKGKGMSGFMAHATDENGPDGAAKASYRGKGIFSSGYGRSPSRTLTVDGCFMCLTKDAMERGLRFDERFSFHFYDMDVCFSAFVKGIAVGTAPVLLTHESIGMSVAQPEFLKMQSLFFEKWFDSKLTKQT